MKIFKCNKGFSIECCDGDGFTIENQYTDIEKDSIWGMSEDTFRVAGGEIRLEQYNGRWLETGAETLEENFTEITKPREKIESFLKDTGYTYTVEAVIEGYKKSKKWYVSYTMEHCIRELEEEIKQLIKNNRKMLKRKTLNEKRKRKGMKYHK